MDIQDLLALEEFYVIDFEYIAMDAPCEIGIVKYDCIKGKIHRIYDTIIDPEIKTSEANIVSLRKCKIKKHQWKGHPSFDDIFPKIESILKDKVVLHWGNADSTVISKTSKRYNLKSFSFTGIDMTAKYFKNNSLDNITKKCGLNTKMLHRAMGDAFIECLLLVSNYDEYQASDDDLIYIDEITKEGELDSGKLRAMDLKKGEGEKGCVCITGLSPKEKKLFAQELENEGYHVKMDVTSKVKFLIVPDKEFDGSPSKFKKANKIGATIISWTEFKRNKMAG